MYRESYNTDFKQLVHSVLVHPVLLITQDWNQPVLIKMAQVSLFVKTNSLNWGASQIFLFLGPWYRHRRGHLPSIKLLSQQRTETKGWRTASKRKQYERRERWRWERTQRGHRSLTWGSRQEGWRQLRGYEHRWERESVFFSESTFIRYVHYQLQ